MRAREVVERAGGGGALIKSLSAGESYTLVTLKQWMLELIASNTMYFIFRNVYSKNTY